jgi:hypothetical protein
MKTKVSTSLLSQIGLVILFVLILYVALKSAGLIKSTIEGMDNRQSIKDRATVNDIKYKREGMGVRAADIPNGDEDLYILKSEVVPPVCPKCPDIVRYRDKPCPPCPPCGRCPEPAFECKKVPSYKSGHDSIPIPVLADFSTFGQ